MPLESPIRRIESWTKLDGAQPNWLVAEFSAMEKEVKKHPEFIAAMKKRDISDFTFIECGALPPGYFGGGEERGRRVAHVQCKDAAGVRNTWPREIAGLTAVVDVNTKQILRIVDEGVTPLARVNADYDQASIGSAREVRSPIRIDQPLGPGFQLHGRVVEWQKWRFHVRPDQRVGMIISTVTYNDGARRRPIMYEGHLSEMFVPYMDPSFEWRRRTFFDAGEYNSGGFAKPLMRGVDCPENSVYMDGLISTDAGRPKTAPNVICIFEREAGDMAWRHFSADPESRRKRDLVVRSAAVLGNYDYVFDWTFQQDGSLRVSVGATGIAEVKSSNVARADAGPADGSGDAYGRFVDQNLIAVNHDHYFNFRIDLDVDGAANSFLADRLVTRILPPDKSPPKHLGAGTDGSAHGTSGNVARRYAKAGAVARNQHDGEKSCRLSNQLPAHACHEFRHFVIPGRLRAPARWIHRS
jgi:primary-amine oxidase